MGNKLAFAIIGLTLLCTAQGWAGSSGNGWAQRNGVKPVAKAHYSFCFGGRPKTVYFSRMIVSAPSATKPDLNAPFGSYLTNAYGSASNNGGQCFTSEVMADVENTMKQREAEFRARTWKIVETKWNG